MNWRGWSSIGSEAVSRPTLMNQTKLVMHHQHHDMRAQAKVENRRHLWVVRYQQFTFWLITFEQSVRKLNICVYGFLVSCRIRRCQLCQDWLNPCRPFWNVSYIFISSEPFKHIVTKIGRDHLHHVLDVPQKYEDSATYCSRDITILEKMHNF